MNSKIKIVISLFSITVILACVLQVFPKCRQLQQYNSMVQDDTSDQSNSIDETSSAATNDIYSKRSGSTADEITEANEDFISDQDYENIQSKINAVKERINLLNNNITSDLTDITKNVFSQITSISAKPNEEELRNECKQYMTDDFYNHFYHMEFKRESYLVYDIKFSDLDKDDITAYVLTRSSEQTSFFVTYSFDENKNYVISNIIQIS